MVLVEHQSLVGYRKTYEFLLCTYIVYSRYRKTLYFLERFNSYLSPLLRITKPFFFSLIALVTAAIFAVDLNLYGYWGFRLDGSVLIYLSDPGEALASASWGEVLRQILIMLVYAGAMIWSYRWILRLFRVEPVQIGRASCRERV